MLMLCYACAYAYALVRTSLNAPFFPLKCSISRPKKSLKCSDFMQLMRKCEKRKTNRWVRSSHVSAYVDAYVAGDLTCYAYVMHMLVKTSLSAHT